MDADEIVEDKNQNQGRQVADEIELGAADQPIEKAGNDPAKSHHRADDRRQGGRPETQPDRVHQADNENVRHPLPFPVVEPE